MSFAIACMGHSSCTLQSTISGMSWLPMCQGWEGIIQSAATRHMSLWLTYFHI